MTESLIKTGSALLTDPSRICRSSIAINEGLREKKPIVIRNYLFDHYMAALSDELDTVVDLWDRSSSGDILQINHSGDCSRTPYSHMFSNLQNEVCDFLSRTVKRTLISTSNIVYKISSDTGSPDSWSVFNKEDIYYWQYYLCTPLEPNDGGQLEYIKDFRKVNDRYNVNRYEIDYQLVPSMNTMVILKCGDMGGLRVKPVEVDNKEVIIFEGFFHSVDNIPVST